MKCNHTDVQSLNFKQKNFELYRKNTFVTNLVLDITFIKASESTCEYLPDCDDVIFMLTGDSAHTSTDSSGGRLHII